MSKDEIGKLFDEYLDVVDVKAVDILWQKQGEKFRKFWNTRVLDSNKPLTDDEIDEIVLILDKNGKGSTRETQAVAKMMIPQGQWRKMFRQLQKDKDLGGAMNNLFIAGKDQERITAINQIYALNEGSKNHMTGKSGNGINGLLAAFNPTDNCSIVSLPSRLSVCKLFDFELPADFRNLSQGEKMILTNKILLQGFKNLGLNYSPRILSQFCYFEPIKELIGAMETECEDEDEPEVRKDNSEAEFKLAIANYDQADVESYFEMLDQILEELSITQPDERITFSCKRKRLSLIVGQRYCYSLYREAGEVVWQCISNKKINSNSTRWEGPHEAYYTVMDSAEEVSENLEPILEGTTNELERTTQSGFRGSSNPYFERAAFDKVYRIDIITGTGSSAGQANRKQERTMIALNQIFFGPPGTGKTFNTVDEAVRIADPDFYAKNEHKRVSLKQRFQELLITNWEKGGQIAFCTFHQSFSYEDFVEGIKPVKPVEGDSYLKYRIEDGIFKRLCRMSEDSRKSKQLKTDRLLSWDEESFRKASFYKISLGDSQDPDDQEIFDYCIKNKCIALGYGQMNDFSGLDESGIVKKCKELGHKDFAAQALNYFIHYLKPGNYVLVSYGNHYVRALGRVKGEYRYNPNSGIRYSQFRDVEWLITDETIPIDNIYDRKLSQSTIYKLDGSGIRKEFFVPGSELKLNENVKDKNYVLIIDEINRGNVSSIFGELITLIERNKRASGRKDSEELEVILPYSKEAFKVPDNVHIIGTMNTADRSIEALDTALRRRFSFREMPSEPEILTAMGASKGKIENIDLVLMLTAINQRIEKLIDKDHKIGHAYFMEDVTVADLRATFENKVVPLLQEYFFGDFGKIGLVLGSSFIDKRTDSFEFARFQGFDQGVIVDLKERPVYQLKKPSEWNFRAIYEQANPGI